MAPNAHDAPARDIPPPIPEADAFDDANAMPVPMTIVDVGVAPALVAPAMVRTAMMPIAIPVAIAMPDLNRQIGPRRWAAIGRRG